MIIIVYFPLKSMVKAGESQIGIYRTKAFPWGKVDFPICPVEGQIGKDG
jgi:hypothetical protein